MHWHLFPMTLCKMDSVVSGVSTVEEHGQEQ